MPSDVNPMGFRLTATEREEVAALMAQGSAVLGVRVTGTDLIRLALPLLRRHFQAVKRAARRAPTPKGERP